MPNLINRLASETPQQQQMLPQLSESIGQVRNLMTSLRNNPLLIQKNPQLNSIIQMYKNRNLKEVATQLAQSKGVDINEVVNQLLQGG